MTSSKRIKTYVRIKPTDHFDEESIELHEDGKTLTIRSKKDLRRGYINNQILDWKFCSDGVLHNSSQEEVYKCCASQLVSNAVNGFNSTIFAYGETGGGKTYSMTGTTNNFKHRGIIPRAISQLYQEIKDRHEEDFKVKISYLEIYKEHMYDLLATLPAKGSLVDSCEMSVTEDSLGRIHVKGLRCYPAESEEDALNLLFEGEMNRMIGYHQLNRSSSRSHCIFTIHIESHSRTQSNTKYTVSKLNMVDLAGSERLGKTQSKGETELEAMHINKSLTFLEQAVIALEDKTREHIPFRQSKLTHILKDSIGGKCHTVMLANIWGEKSQIEETLSTLRFASRVMNIACDPAINFFIDPVRLCKEYEKEITNLRQELNMYDTLTNRNQVSYEPLSDVQISDIQQEIHKFVNGDIEDINILSLRQVREVFQQLKKMVNNAEGSVEARIREKYVLYEKNETVEKGAEGTPITQERTGLVGDPDGHGFGVGKVGPGVKPALPSAVANSKRKIKRQKEVASPDRKTHPIDRDAHSPHCGVSQADQKTLGSMMDASPSLEMHVAGPSPTPPTKEEAFEQFKVEAGADLSKVLTENKDIVKRKKREAKSLTESVNQFKSEMDQLREKLTDLKISKDNLKESAASGEVILDEEEFDLMQGIRSLKVKYRVDHDMLMNVRSDIAYCEKLISQCRTRLLMEFDSWYKDSFAINESEPHGKAKPVDHPILRHRPTEDDGEKFDRVQKQMLAQHPESVAFHNARMQTERRRILNISPRRTPGSVTATLRNAPPGTLIVN